MTDLPPRTTVPRTDADRVTTTTTRSQTGMWLIPLLLAILILGAVAFTMNRTADGPDPVTTAPETVDPAPAETDTGAATDTGTATETDPGADTAEPTTPAPGTTGGTTQPAP